MMEKNNGIFKIKQKKCLCVNIYLLPNLLFSNLTQYSTINLQKGFVFILPFLEFRRNYVIFFFLPLDWRI